MILVPIKNLANAKQRLSAVLSPEQRFALAQAMCEDVLQELAFWQKRPAVAVVTQDPFARDLAAKFGFEIIADDHDGGETSAIEMATAVCRERGSLHTLVVPADIPLIEGGELQAIAEAAPPAGAVLVPDAAGRGTNAAWRSPADLFPLRFGNDSFLPHLAAAKATGLALCRSRIAGDRAGCRSSGRSARTGSGQRQPKIAEAGTKLGTRESASGLPWPGVSSSTIF
jgi:2-phospho-L-lactate/phosphoenolpyruvate guanylyltransferase